MTASNQDDARSILGTQQYTMKFLLSCFAVLLISSVQLTEGTYFFPICGPSGSAFENGISFIQESVQACVDKIVKKEPKREPSSLLEWIFGIGTVVEDESNFLSGVYNFLLNLQKQLVNNLVMIIIISSVLLYCFASRLYIETSKQNLILETSDNEEETSGRESEVGEDAESDYETTSGKLECNKCTCGSFSSVSESGDGKIKKTNVSNN